MSINALIVPLLGVPLFQDLKPLQLKAIALRTERALIAPGVALITKGVPVDAASLIVDGTARIQDSDYSGDDAEIGPGDIVAEMAMLVETVPGSTIVSESYMNVLTFTRADMHELMDADPEIAGHFVEALRLRLREVADVLRDVDDALAGGPPRPPRQGGIPVRAGSI